MTPSFTANFLYNDLVLASASPQRQAILREYGFRFITAPADIDESFPAGLAAASVAESLALQKAQKVAPLFPNAVILGADTVVVSADGRLLGKAVNADEAAEMLRQKAGRKETVITAYCLLSEQNQVLGHEISTVFYHAFGEPEISRVIASGEWREVAGALRVEGPVMRGLIQKTEGDYHNIIGLPIGRIAQILRDFPLPGTP
jgi:septum formation protein